MWWNKQAFVLGLVMAATGLLPVQAQEDSLPAFNKGAHYLYVSARFELNASSLTNEFIGQYYKGAYLGDELKERNSGRLNDQNIAGYSLDGGICYMFAPGTWEGNFGYYIGVEEHSMAAISFRKSFFDLMFFGNEAYTDQFVKFDNMQLNLMEWQQIKTGIYKAWKTDQSFHQLGGAIGMNIGQQNLMIDVEKASLFTQKDAEYVALDMDMEIHKSDSNRTSFGSFNGYGGSIDLSYNYSDLANHEFQFRLSNLGYIRWDQAPDHFTRDTTIKYEGFDADLFDLDQPLFDENFGDSMTHAMIGEDLADSYITMLPMEINLMYTYYIDRHFSLSAEGRHKFFTVYRPFLSISPGVHFKIKNAALSIHPCITYGGYGSWNFGADLKTRIGGKTFFSLGTNTLNSLIDPRGAAGLSGFFTLYQSL